MKWLRSRVIIHISGAVLANELSLALLTVAGFSKIWVAAIAAPLVGLVSELYDFVNEHSYPGKNIKHLTDFLSWCFGSCVFVTIELLKRW